MAYVTGTANNFSQLLAAVQSACTANGWTLSGNVLHKGTCYIEVITVAQDYPCLRVQGGTGVDGSNNLTGRSGVQAAQIGLVALQDLTTGRIPADVAFTFPMTYQVHVHSSPDEVYLVVNYATVYYQILAFGQSNHPGLSGTGNWYAATDMESNSPALTVDQRRLGGALAYGGHQLNGGLFMTAQDKSVDSAASAVHHALESDAWLIEGASRDWYDIQANSPNLWNSESVLNPMRVYAPRADGFFSVVLEPAHARFVNLRSLDDQAIITLGSDRWKVYPWWARGLPYDVNGNGGTLSGLAGHAIRYDGA